MDSDKPPPLPHAYAISHNSSAFWRFRQYPTSVPSGPCKWALEQLVRGAGGARRDEIEPVPAPDEGLQGRY